MIIERKKQPLVWGKLDLALFGLTKDWHGEALDKAAAFGLAMDDEHLWFVATRRKAALTLPEAMPFEFTPELWKYDVAELFIRHPQSGRYLEFNLAANGAWWSAEFTEPRRRAESVDIPMPGVTTYAELADDNTWLSAASISLDVLRARLDFGEHTEMNVTMIVDSPEQRFLSASEPPSGKPDFHQMGLMQRVKILDGGLTFHDESSALDLP
ncbi:MAG: hypothetical protein ACSHX0_01410 [Akkermansiaceae bacterium]